MIFALDPCQRSTPDQRDARRKPVISSRRVPIRCHDLFFPLTPLVRFHRSPGRTINAYSHLVQARGYLLLIEHRRRIGIMLPFRQIYPRVRD